MCLSIILYVSIYHIMFVSVYLSHAASCHICSLMYVSIILCMHICMYPSYVCIDHIVYVCSVQSHLIASWGCLAYLCLTSEQRSKKKMDKKWGPRAIAGIFIGCYVNPKTDIYHFLIHDGRTIFATSETSESEGIAFHSSTSKDGTFR